MRLYQDMVSSNNIAHLTSQTTATNYIHLYQLSLVHNSKPKRLSEKFVESNHRNIPVTHAKTRTLEDQLLYSFLYTCLETSLWKDTLRCHKRTLAFPINMKVWCDHYECAKQNFAENALLVIWQAGWYISWEGEYCLCLHPIDWMQG